MNLQNTSVGYLSIESTVKTLFTKALLTPQGVVNQRPGQRKRDRERKREREITRGGEGGYTEMRLSY